MQHLWTNPKIASNLLAVCVAFLLIQGTLAEAQSSVDKAWNVLQAGLSNTSTDKRASAVRVLGLLEKDRKAPELGLQALADARPEVRAAAADALGQMKATAAAPKLGAVITGDEKDAAVIIACARSMIALGDRRGYNVYYAVLTGEKKGGSSLLDDQKKMLSDPKKMARFGFEQGIGFVPFGGIGYAGFKMLTKDDSSPVRAAAAKILADDRDPVTLQALVNAASDKSWIVRMAALDSLARRNDPSIISQIDSKLDDRNDAVRYTAAAAVIRLSQIKIRPATKRGTK